MKATAITSRGTPRSWMTLPEVCDELGVARSTIDDWRATGRGPQFVRLPNGQLRIRRADFDAWLANLPVVA